MKIQRIEADPETGARVFHVSLVGLKLSRGDTVAHAPVSHKTLDLSVTHLCDDTIQFPAADEGIAEWRRASGGVYSVTLAEIVEMSDLDRNA